MIPDERNPDRVDCPSGQDALCFTAGGHGVHFGAGVVHAYLAADREPPVAVAGISTGALTGAAMYQAYKELLVVPKGSGDEVRESTRWRAFRAYLDKLTNNPLAPVWDAIPNPSEFFGESTPVEDPSCPEALKQKETEARAHHHRLIRLGNWFSGLPVSVSDLADAAVRYVRCKESPAIRPLQFLMLVARVVWITVLVAFHLARDPRMAWRPLTFEDKSPRRKWRPQPLFGWGVWAPALLWLPVIPVLLLFGILWRDWHGWWLGFAAFIWIFVPAAVAGAIQADWLSFSRVFLKPAGIHRGLLHKYHLRRWLLELFGDLEIESPMRSRSAPCTLLVVAAPLNALPGAALLPSLQLWARPKTLVRDALAAALTAPALFSPELVDAANWLDERGGENQQLQLVDGIVIRSNPLPALFNWIHGKFDAKRDCDPVCQAYRIAIAKLFHTKQNPAASLRVVYSVPIASLPREEEALRESMNIVENGFTSMSLQRRRDTELESQQTYFISQLESEIRAQGEPRPGATNLQYPIMPIPISPQKELVYENGLNPTRKEALAHVANGCRRTLECIYRHRLAATGGKSMPCADLLHQIAPHRAAFVQDLTPGLPEVCATCSRMLTVRPVETSDIDKSAASYGSSRHPHQVFPRLTGNNKSRVVFLANGGVFRGSFHIGVAAALRMAKVTPDLVVGSSVGAIVGAAVCAMGKLNDEDARQHIRQMASVFLNCDTQVALTRQLKNAVKELGVRARSIDVSPRLVRRLVRDGSRRDSAYSLTGAPPVLIDAISNLFLIPHKTTRRICARFIAGHVTRATHLFWKALPAETLRRLEIMNCILGSELLSGAAKTLLFPEKAHIDRFKVQPYLDQDGGGTAFFATATHLSRRTNVLLGRDFPGEIPTPAHYDFLEACLASAAFPVVFAPRTVSALFPGRGRTDALLSDGGIFDNLPFFPAIRVLSEVQESFAAESDLTPLEYLRRRHDHPVLFIAAGLECSPDNPMEPPSDVFEVRRVAQGLQNNVKVGSFEKTSEIVHTMTERLIKAYEHCPEKVNASFVNSMVSVSVLKVLPQDQDHLNGTFAFCRAMGLDKKRMALSIAHGCFQTLSALVKEPAEGTIVAKSLASCREEERIAKLVRVRQPRVPGEGQCPFYKVEDEHPQCPFHGTGEVGAIYTACVEAASHHEVAASGG